MDDGAPGAGRDPERVLIREATAADLDALAALQGPTMGPDAWTRGQLAEELGRPGGIFLVDDALRGFVIAWVVFDEVNLLQIGVGPEHRRGGLAGALHDALWQAAPGAGVGWLEVRADNGPARRFYEKHRWQELGRRPRYYADGTDAVLYRRG